MRKQSHQWISVAAFLVFGMLLCVWNRPSDRAEDCKVLQDLSELEGKQISGVTAKSPDDSMTIFLNSYFGTDFGRYRSFDRFDEAFSALTNRKVSAMWVTDITAEYLKQKEPVAVLRPKEQPGQGKDRFSFAFAFRPDSTELLEQANDLIRSSRDSGQLAAMATEWMSGNGVSSKVAESDREPLYIGITGTVPPLETVSPDGTVSGMAVELAKQLAERTNRRPVFLVLNNETAFARLMAGRVDMIACYGTSENHSSEFPEYRMSEGYIGVTGYSLLVLDYGAKDTVDCRMMTMIKDNLISGGAYSLILKSVLVTAVIFLGAVLLSGAVGLLLNRAMHSRHSVPAGIAAGLGFLFRSTPVLLGMLLLDFGIFGASHGPQLILAVLAIGLYGAGCMADVLRDTEETSISKILVSGRKEWKRLLLQLLQWTTVTGYIGLNDLTAVMQGIGNRTMYPTFSIVFTIVMYLLAVLVIELAFRLWEKKEGNSDENA